MIDDFNREGPGIEADFSLPGKGVILTLERIVEWRGNSRTIRCDNGPEYICAVMTNWTQQQGIRLEYTRPGDLSPALVTTCVVRAEMIGKDYYESTST